MRKLVTMTAVLLMIGATGLTAGGCLYAAAAAAGAGAYAYVQGESRANVEGSVREVARAAEAAVESLDMFLVSSEADDLRAEVRAETRGGKDVRIRIERLTDSSSELRIRVGAFGDKDIGRAVYDRIVERLERR